MRGKNVRFIFFILGTVIAVCLFIYFNLLYRGITLNTPLPTHDSTSQDSDTQQGEGVKNIDLPATTRRANATIVILARNSDISGVVKSIQELENRFNHRYTYPYTFLNEVPFTEEFKSNISLATNSSVEFAVIPKEYWYQPEWIDEDKAAKGREGMVQKGVKYGDSVAYRNMCRFNSGFFFKHEALEKYRWYWRVEPNVHFHCDINFDPFLFMEDNNKTYSFTIATYEIPHSIPSLWKHVLEFTQKYPEYISENNSMNFISLTGGRTYSMCHFWSNFEVADMNFWRSPAYTQFFEYLDSTGGFYYERWGDAPVHSIAASLLLPRDRIHFFEEIGYQHDDWIHCPLSEDIWKKGNCNCNRAKSFDIDKSSCKAVWDRMNRGQS